MITEVLEKIPTHLLVDVFLAKGLKSEKRRPPREEVLPKVEELIQGDSLKQFVNLMQKKELKEWAKKIKKHVLAARNNNTNSSAVMRKRLFEQLQEQGLEAYMEKLSPSERLLCRTLMDMGVAAKKSDGREELSKLLLSEIEMAGIEGFMKNSFTVSQLKQIAEEQNIKAQTASPNILVECIITGKDYTPEKKIVKKKKKPAKEDEKEKKEEVLDPLIEGTSFDERAPWKMMQKILYSFSDDESDDEKEWVDKEKLKDVPYKDEVPEEWEEVVKSSNRAPRNRKVNEGVSYLLVESEEEEKDSEEESSDGEYGKPKKEKKKKEDKEKEKKKKEKKDKKRKREKKDKEDDEDRKERKHKKHKSKKDREEDETEKPEDETEKSEKKGKKKDKSERDEEEEPKEDSNKKNKKDTSEREEVDDEEEEKLAKKKKKEEEKAKKKEEEKAKKKEEEKAKKKAEEEAERKKKEKAKKEEVSDKENDEDEEKERKNKKKDKKQKQY